VSRRARILLVEDDPILARMILRALERPEWQVLPVCRLTDALGSVTAWGADLVILDRKLPDGDGLDLCRQVRANPDSASVRILVLTGARLETSEKVEAFEAGADEYLIKPVPPMELVARVRALIQFKQAEDALREREAQFRLAFENAVDAILWVDPETGILLNANPAAGRLFECRAQELIGRSHTVLLPAAESAKVWALLQDLGNSSGHELEMAFQTLAGAPREVVVSISATRMGGRMVLQGMFRDISARKAAEKEIRKLRQALEQSPATVVVAGLDGTIEYVNSTFEALTGYTTAEAVGLNTRALKSGLHGQAFYQELWETILDGRIWRGKFNNRKKNGELFWEKATIAPVFDEKGQITCFVAVKEDVTELMRTEAALQAAKNAADAASQAKSSFLANMSHEIRTPLNAVLGFIHLLEGTSLGPQQQEYLGKAKVSAEHLHGTISDILDFSKIEAGRMDLEVIPFDLRECLGNLAGILSHRAAEKGLRLTFDLDPELPPLLLGDPLRLGQVLLNFGSNAVKFTAHGEVTVTAKVLERAQGRVRLRFEVRDTGIGLTETQLEGLFQPFSQADGSTTRRFGGTGLGLAICRRLARLMDGAIEVASQPGQGSCFALVLALPEAAADPKARRRQEPPKGPDGVLPLQGIQVLLVEDNDLNQQVVKEILRRAGARVSVAGNGQEALDRLREQPFDGVLMDLQMPGMGGLEAARRIRGNPAWAELPIIALTADALAGVREKVLAAGMNDYLAKPIEPALLVRCLSGLILKAGFEFPAARAEAAELTGNLRGVDIASALARLGLDPETYLGLLRRFSAGQEAGLAGIRAAMDQGDRETALRQAHSLKGAALNLGAGALGGAARDLEECLQGGGAGWPARLQLIQELMRELEEGLALLPEQELEPGAPDWSATRRLLEALQQALREDDARAGRDLAELAALLKGGPLQAALAPLKARIENYDYRRALELFPEFQAKVETLGGIPNRS
jgi:PAS domain S-box-containing protein